MHNHANGAAAGEKAGPDFPDWNRAVNRSAIDPQHIVTQQTGWDSLGETLLMAAASTSTGIRPWGSQVFLRDRQLRAFITQEPYTMSAIASVIARNVGLSWQLDGPIAVVEKTQDVFHAAQFGQGWETLMTKVGWDYETQDKGGFIELVRDEDVPESPVIGMNQVDAGRCWHTGNPLVPVLYQDRIGRWHGFKWWQVITPSEMPVAHETLYGLQYSALTRCLVIAETLRNILKMHEEHTAGRWTRAVHILSGVKKLEVDDAMKARQQENDNMGLMRFGLPAILTTTDPSVEPKLLTLSLATLPEGFELDVYMKWYLTAIAMGLFVDYGELAPLPGNGLGTSAQSKQMHQKTRTKGIAIWTNKFEHLFNFFGVVPRNVTFRYEDKDLDEDQSKADIFAKYAEGFVKLITTGGMDGQAALEILLDIGIIPQDVFDGLIVRLTAAGWQTSSGGASDVTVPDNQSAGAARQRGGTQANDSSQAENQDRPPTAGAARGTELGQREMTIPLDEPRAIVEGRMTKAAKRALDAMSRNVTEKIEGSKEKGSPPRTFWMGGEAETEAPEDLETLAAEVRDLRDQLSARKSHTVTKEVIRDPDGRIIRIKETKDDSPATTQEIERAPDGRIVRIKEA